MDSFGNTSNITANYDNSGITVQLGAMAMMFATATLNLLCLVILFKDKKLKEKRFETMTICLSISDVLTSCLIIVSGIRNIIFQLTGSRIKVVCYVIMSLMTATWIFSLLQIFWICIERLLATFPATKNPCFKIPVIVMYLILYGVCLLFILTYYAIIGDVWTDAGCTYQTLLGKNRLMSVSVMNPLYLIIISAMVVMYSVTIYRTYTSWKKVSPGPGATSGKAWTAAAVSSVRNESVSQTGVTSNAQPSTSQQKDGKAATNNRASQMVKLVITLGMLLGVLLISYMPKVCLAIAYIVNPNNFQIQMAMFYSEFALFITPLINPVIYVLRIKRFRERLTCSCCINSK